jgi:O-6-methylguanine DNA methyltransferase
MVEIALEPGIRVQPLTKAGSLLRISLFSSPRFTLDTEGCDPKLIQALTAWLKSYAARKPTRFPLSLTSDSFQGDVLRFLQTIPLGTVLSYQEVAKAVGSPRAARAVGNICRGNLFPLLIPCHRVIRSDGKMGQYTPDPNLKNKLLYFEGVITLSCATVFS